MARTLLLLFAWLFSLNAQAQNIPFDTQAQRLIDSLAKTTGVPAFSFAAVHHGEVIASITSGYSNLKKQQKATPDQLFRLASVSKIIGATMLAEIAVNGQLDPDAPIGSFYPELHKNYHTITVRQLMAHISGMPHYQARDMFIGSKHYDSAIDALETLKDRSLLSGPGQKYQYSSHAYTLAGAIYEKITGKQLNTSLPRYIRALTGRSTPKIEDITKVNPKRAGLYERSSDRMVPVTDNDKSYSIFGAGLTATASDLAMFGSALLDKSKKSKELNRLLFTPAKLSNGKDVSDRFFKVGFGWRISEDPKGRTVYHHAGSTPGARSVIILYPDEGLSLAFLSNASWVSSIEQTAYALADLYLTNSKRNSTPFSGLISVHFDDKVTDGSMKCADGICEFSDSNGPFTKWLNRFNPTNEKTITWRAIPTQGKDGPSYTLVTKVGLMALTHNPTDGTFRAPIGSSRQLMLSPK